MPFKRPLARTFDFRSPPPALGSVTLTCDFVTLAAGDVCLHALDFVGGHPGRLVDGEGPEQPVLDGLVNLSGCHAEDPAGLGDGIGTKLMVGSSLNEPLQLSRQPLGTRGWPKGEPGLDEPFGLRDRQSCRFRRRMTH